MEDAYLDSFMEDRMMGGGENYWEDDLYQYNLNEADDYRNEMDDYDDWD